MLQARTLKVKVRFRNWKEKTYSYKRNALRQRPILLHGWQTSRGMITFIGTLKPIPPPSSRSITLLSLPSFSFFFLNRFLSLSSLHWPMIGRERGIAISPHYPWSLYSLFAQSMPAGLLWDQTAVKYHHRSTLLFWVYKKNWNLFSEARREQEGKTGRWQIVLSLRRDLSRHPAHQLRSLIQQSRCINPFRILHYTDIRRNSAI